MNGVLGCRKSSFHSWGSCRLPISANRRDGVSPPTRSNVRCHKALTLILAIGVVGLLALAVAAAGDEDAAAWERALNLFNRAIAAEDGALYREAIGLYEQALEIVRDLGRSDAEVRILHNLGLCYETLLEFEQAIDCHKQALEIFRALNGLVGEAGSLTSLGGCYESLAKYSQAIGYYEQALVIRREIGDHAGEVVCLSHLGDCYESLLEYQSAIKCFDQLREVFREIEDRSGEASVLGILGLCYEALWEYQRAIDHLEQSLTVLKEIGDRSGVAATLGLLGLCHESLSEYHWAIDCYEQSLTIYVDIGSHAGEADTLQNLGNCYSALSDHQRALDYYGQALTIYVCIGDRSGEAASLNNLGICHSSLSENRQAIDYYEQALTIYVGVGDRSGEAGALNNLGNCYSSLSDDPRAIDYFEQSLAIFVEIGDGGGEAASLNNLGVCYSALSEYHQAIGYYERALTIYVDIGDRSGEAASLNNAGLCYWALSECERAIDCHEQALAIFADIEDRAGEAASLNNLGNCISSLLEYARAIDYYEQALTIQREIGDFAGEAASLSNMGNCYSSLSEHEMAIGFYDGALEIAQAIGDESTAWHAHWGLGSTHRRLDEFSEALGHYADAVSIVEGIRERVESESLQQSFFGGLKSLYEEYLELLFKADNESSMLWVAERCRARSMLDLLTNGGVASNEALEGMTVQGTVDADGIQSLLEGAPGLLEEDEAVLIYAWGTEHLFTWVVTASGGIEGPNVQEIEYDDALERIYEFRTQLETWGSLAEVHQDLRWLSELLVEPVIDQVGTYDTWIIVPSGPLWYVPYTALPLLQTSSYVIERHVVAYAPSLTSLSNILDTPDDVSATPTLALANPRREDLPSLSTELMEAMQGFAAALGEGSVYTEEAASESLLYEMFPPEAASSSYDYLALACHGIFRYGNPLYSYLALTPTAEETGVDGNLEAREVLNLGLEGTDMVLLAACETFLTSVASQTNSAKIAGIPKQMPEDQKLDILRSLMRGDELLGLSRSFLLAGASSVLATQWELYVPTAEEFLPLLGANLASGMPRGEAVQAAVCEMLRQERERVGVVVSPWSTQPGLDNPWVWSPFILIGDWR